MVPFKSLIYTIASRVLETIGKECGGESIDTLLYVSYVVIRVIYMYICFFPPLLYFLQVQSSLADLVVMDMFGPHPLQLEARKTYCSKGLVFFKEPTGQV